jgi:hypothetical protein
MVLAGCAVSTSPTLAPFAGQDNDSWLAYRIEIERDDLLLAFEASARGYGCMTKKIGTGSRQIIGGGEKRSHHGIHASCRGQDIAMINLRDGAMIGCPKPTTREACDGLLRKISEGR